jgi:hypothetical protein
MQRMLCFRFGVLAVIGVVLSACASDTGAYKPLFPQTAPDPASFSHRTASPDVELLWDCSQPRPEVMMVTGAVRNIGQRDVQSVMLRARSLRLGEMPILLTEEALPEIILYFRNLSSFHIDLKLEKAPWRIDLLAQYQVTPNPNQPSLAGPPIDLKVEDACAPARYPNSTPRISIPK